MALVPPPKTSGTSRGNESGRFRLPLAGGSVPLDMMHAADLPAEGFRLSIRPEGVLLAAGDAAGQFYGQAAWDQLCQGASPRWGGDGTVACDTITDWPDLPRRGVMLDISRDRVPTLAQLRSFIDQLARLRVNELQLYTEHTFAYRGHEAVWAQADPLTPAEVRELVTYAAARHITLVPNQNTFGHFERWLKHSAYQSLSELPQPRAGDGVPAFYLPRIPPQADGSPAPGSTLCPATPETLALLADLLDQLREVYPGSTINIGGDETFDLGLGRSRQRCATRGKGEVYLDHLAAVHHLCADRGWSMQYWGDLAWHHPELLGEAAERLPGATAMVWGYEQHQDFRREAAMFQQAGIPFYVCPATATFNAIAGRATTCRINQLHAADAAAEYGAAGVLNTIWGDYGHWNAPITNDPGLVLGAALAWNRRGSQDLDLIEALSQLYDDPSRELARGLLTLAGVEDDLRAVECPNSLSWTLLKPGQPTRNDGGGIWLDRGWDWIGPLNPAALEAVQDRLAAGRRHLGAAAPGQPEARAAVADLHLAGSLLQHAARQLQARHQAQARHVVDLPADTRQALGTDLRAMRETFATNWLRTSRAGGLADSLRPLIALQGYYDQR